MENWLRQDTAAVSGGVFFNNPMANSGANFSKYFDLRRRENEGSREIDVATRRKIFANFMKREMCLKIDTPTLTLGVEVIVRFDHLSVSPGFPVETLPFFLADEAFAKTYGTELQVIDEVYKALDAITFEHLMPLKHIQEGNVGIVYCRKKYRRAVILTSLEPSVGVAREDVKNEPIRCSLLDDGYDVIVPVNSVYYTIPSFLKLPPRVMKFRLWGLADYSNTTEYYDLLKTLLPKGMLYFARVVQLNQPSGFADVVLTTRPHQSETINHIILKGLFSIFSGTKILNEKTFCSRVYLANVFSDGRIALHIHTPLLKHFRGLISAAKSKMVEALKTTGGEIHRDEVYIYVGKVDTYRVYAQANSSADCETVPVMAFDVGHQFIVNKSQLAHIDLFKAPSEPFNILQLLPQLLSHAHFVNVKTLDVGEWFDKFDPYAVPYFLRKFPASAKGKIPDVDLYSEQLQRAPGVSLKTLNQVIMEQGHVKVVERQIELDSFCKAFSSFNIKSEEGNWV